MQVHSVVDILGLKQPNVRIANIALKFFLLWHLLTLYMNKRKGQTFVTPEIISYDGPILYLACFT